MSIISEPNVGMFGSGPADTGAYHTAWESAAAAEKAANLSKKYSDASQVSALKSELSNRAAHSTAVSVENIKDSVEVLVRSAENSRHLSDASATISRTYRQESEASAVKAEASRVAAEAAKVASEASAVQSDTARKLAEAAAGKQSVLKFNTATQKYDIWNPTTQTWGPLGEGGTSQPDEAFIIESDADGYLRLYADDNKVDLYSVDADGFLTLTIS